MRTEPLRLALVGLGYGVVYLEAIAGIRGVELVALGARGSRRSRGIARELGLPLHTDVHSLLEAARPDAVLVAVPPDVAAPLVPTILRAGRHVLSEFPIEAADAAAAQAAAQAGGAHFEVNAHFSRLAAPTAFARACATEGAPSLVDIVCHERTLFPCLDTTRRAFGHAFVPERAMAGVALGRIGPAPASIRVTPLLSAVDDGSDVFFGQRISAAYAATDARPAGRTVTLVDTFGPVLASGESLAHVTRRHPPTPAAGVAAERARANRAVLQGFVRACRSPEARPDARVLVEVARSYTDTVDLLDTAA